MREKLLNVKEIPLSLYIHLPWCKKKCPFCDFNSHQIISELPEEKYCQALLNDFFDVLPVIRGRNIKTIFFGGGTPNIFSPKSIGNLLSEIKKNTDVDINAEVTLESNPSIFESDDSSIYENLSLFRQFGINRLSVGVQTFNDSYLKNLGRDYTGADATKFLTSASKIFDDVNVDLMYGIPNQNIENALKDISLITSFNVNHISLYQLNIEPNTYFYKYPPKLPSEDLIEKIYKSNVGILNKNEFFQYEISAYANNNKKCMHNLNYWKFGDYVGIGSGAHSKITTNNNLIERHECVKNPSTYLKSLTEKPRQKYRKRRVVNEKDIIFEFMLNGLRLTDGISISDFLCRTGCKEEEISPQVDIALQKGLLEKVGNTLKPTIKGLNFLNDLQIIFLQS